MVVDNDNDDDDDDDNNNDVVRFYVHFCQAFVSDFVDANLVIFYFGGLTRHIVM